MNGGADRLGAEVRPRRMSPEAVRRLRRLAAALALAATALALAGAARQAGDPLHELRRQFVDPPSGAGIMMRWWWFGPAVTPAGLERELRTMKSGGIAGVEIQPVYPLALDDEHAGIRTQPFLSEGFLESLRFANEKGRELGLRVDVTLGSGWPFGGPQVPAAFAAGKLRIERRTATPGGRIPLPHLEPVERLLGAFLVSAAPGLEPARRLQLPERQAGSRDPAALELPGDLGGTDDVLFVIASRTGMMVKRPAVGAEGFVLNHYDRPSLDHYLAEVGTPLLRAFGGAPPNAVFCDSLEVYDSDWTDDLPAEFEKRRGYGIVPHLPALVSGTGGTAAAVRHDWGRTLSELFEERFLAPLRAWTRAHGSRLRVQAYGIPPATIASSAHADIPEGEGADWHRLTATRWASSGSHLFGRTITSAETWTWLHSPVFMASPLDLKVEADRHFLQGINQLVGHGWPYTPDTVPYPGWRFYAAGVFNEKNPWWLVMPDVSRYLQRVSFLLRQGAPVADVAVYLPTSDAWAHFSPGRANLFEALRERLGSDLFPSLVSAGFSFDVFDDETLRRRGDVRDGVLAFGDRSYRIVVLPGIERMPLDTLRTFATFAAGGGVLVATRRLPALAPGLQTSADEQRAVADVARQTFEGAAATGRFVADERGGLRSLLASGAGVPDVRLEPATSDVGFVHRRTPEADVYFIANTANVPVTAQATFRVSRRRLEAWDPLTGRVATPATLRARSDGVRLPLALAPYESRILLFGDGAPPARQPARQASVPPAIDISDGWRVRFGAGGPSAPYRLRSWTEDPQTRFFSGRATYERQLEVPAALPGPGRRLWLDFGESRPVPPEPLRTGMRAWLEAPVREAAVVFVNGRRAGSVWAPPYAIDLTRELTTGANEVRVEVGNLAINHLAGTELPSHRLLHLRYGQRFDPQDMDKVRPVTAGLLGPIRLVVRVEP